MVQILSPVPWFQMQIRYISLYVMCEALIHHCFAPLLVDKSFKVVFNPIVMLFLGMPVLGLKVYYNIKLGSPLHTVCWNLLSFRHIFYFFEPLSTVHGNTPIMWFHLQFWSLFGLSVILIGSQQVKHSVCCTGIFIILVVLCWIILWSFRL
jgi:hypothetical protein